MDSNKVNNLLLTFASQEEKIDFLMFITKYVDNLSKKSERYDNFKRILHTAINNHECEEPIYRYYIDGRKIAEGAKGLITKMAQEDIKANKKVTKIVNNQEIIVMELKVLTRPQT